MHGTLLGWFLISCGWIAFTALIAVLVLLPKRYRNPWEGVLIVVAYFFIVTGLLVNILWFIINR
jgi:hypothetical protein